MIEAKKIHELKMRNDPEYAREYEALEEEFSFLRNMILARKRAGMSQADVARAMGGQSAKGGEDRERLKR